MCRIQRVSVGVCELTGFQSGLIVPEIHIGPPHHHIRTIPIIQPEVITTIHLVEGGKFH